MFPNEYLQRWAGRVCLLLVAALGMTGYHFANIRFLPLMAGFAILAGVCYSVRSEAAAAPPTERLGALHSIVTWPSPARRSAKRSSARVTSTGRP